ncbi:hypothetical protein OROHE_018453 [Orobanche hederae]
MASMSIPKEPEQVIKQRDGSVLGKKTILKSDHFPGCHNKHLVPHVDGAPNYRKAKSLPVHGVAIPTIDGIRIVLKHIGADINRERIRVLWINLREAPRWFILTVGLLFCVMWNSPFQILSIRLFIGPVLVLHMEGSEILGQLLNGINRVRVEQMEDRLKEDVLIEAARYGNKILVTDELPHGQMVDQWEPFSHGSIKTPLEVYEELTHQYLVDYERVPITDEKSPKEQDFDIMVHKISQAEVRAEIVFNCQMGRGRTTTGMVIATLIYIHRIGASVVFQEPTLWEKFLVAVPALLPTYQIKRNLSAKENMLSLGALFEGGVEGKRQVDKVIDKCASMQNLREAIARYLSSILCQADEMEREASLSFFVEYLERYYFLVCFAVYLHTEREALFPLSPGQCSFTEWMRARPELYSILRR